MLKDAPAPRKTYPRPVPVDVVPPEAKGLFKCDRMNSLEMEIILDHLSGPVVGSWCL